MNIYSGTCTTSYDPKWRLSGNCFYLSLVLIHFGSCFPFVLGNLHKKRHLHQFKDSRVSFTVCMTVDILLYQLRMAAVHCRPQPPRIFAIDSQRCVDIWLVGHSCSDPFFSEVFFDFSHVVLIGKILSVHADHMCFFLRVMCADLCGTTKLTSDDCFCDALPYVINRWPIIN